MRERLYSCYDVRKTGIRDAYGKELFDADLVMVRRVGKWALARVWFDAVHGVWRMRVQAEKMRMDEDWRKVQQVVAIDLTLRGARFTRRARDVWFMRREIFPDE